jgi:hypothetical protein
MLIDPFYRSTRLPVKPEVQLVLVDRGQSSASPCPQPSHLSLKVTNADKNPMVGYIFQYQEGSIDGLVFSKEPVKNRSVTDFGFQWIEPPKQRSLPINIVIKVIVVLPNEKQSEITYVKIEQP